MKYFALDLEFNQYFDFRGNSGANPEPSCPSEIIQIGVAVMDDDFNITEKRSAVVKPRIYKRLHPYVQKMTGLAPADFYEAATFEELYEDFFSFAFSERAVFCTWGSDDIKDLYKNILYYGLSPKRLTRRHLDVQRLYSVYSKAPSNMQTGLKTAVEALGLDTDEPFHNALNDAVYTARIFKILLGDESILPHIKIQTLNLSELRQKITSRVNAVNLSQLVTYAEKLLKRKLTDAEKEAALAIYDAGRIGRFDTAPVIRNLEKPSLRPNF